MSEHTIDFIRNMGWDDKPYWQLICTCGWETWLQPTETAARERHAEHRAELLLTGRCGCPTCRNRA